MRMKVVGVAAMALLASWSCGPKTPAAPVPAFSFTPELTIGGQDSGPASFGDVRGLAVGPAGVIYVLEAQQQEVRLFDSAGRFVRTLGRRGDGPGEFRGANGIALDRSGGLWVYDPVAHRITQFDSTGRLAGTRVFPTSSYGYLWEGGVDSAGSLYDIQYIRKDTATIQVLRRFNLGTGAADTLALPHCAPRMKYLKFGGDRGYMVMGVPFTGGQYVHFERNDVVWCADTRDVALHRYVPGDTVPTATYSVTVTPEPVTRAELDSVSRAIDSIRQKTGPGDFSRSDVPTAKPALLGLFGDDQGRTWAVARTAEGIRMITFSGEGRVLANSPWSWRFSGPQPEIHGGHLWAAVRDSLDVPEIVRLRINEGSSPSHL